jgi:hypothetical protein
MRTRNNFSFSVETDKILRDLSQKTGLKMSTIIEQAINLWNKKFNEDNKNTTGD